MNRRSNQLDGMSFGYGKRNLCLYGGPYMSRPDKSFNIKMAEEIHQPCDVDIPTVDFEVPNTRDLQEGLLAGFRALLDGKTVYVGCWGGIGRTGLYMASMARAVGIKDPVSYVRKHYNFSAVETEAQAAYIAALPLRWVKFRMRLIYLRKVLTSSKG